MWRLTAGVGYPPDGILKDLKSQIPSHLESSTRMNTHKDALYRRLEMVRDITERCLTAPQVSRCFECRARQSLIADQRSEHGNPQLNGHGENRGRLAFSRGKKPIARSAPCPSQADAAPPPSGRSPRRCCRTRWRVAPSPPARSGAGWVGRSGGRSVPRCLLR